MSKKWLERIGVVFQQIWEGRPSDEYVILLLGPSGSGRSTFINTAIKEKKLKCEATSSQQVERLKPVTTEVDHVRHSDHRSRHFLFIDTPGLDLDDVDLINLQTKTAKISKQVDAIIYLHRVNNPRVTTKNCGQVCRMIGGTDWEKKLIVVTTMWSRVEASVGEHRETELRQKIWGNSNGVAKMARFGETHDDAWKIINEIVG